MTEQIEDMLGSGINELQGEGFMDWIKNLKNVILNPSKSLSVVPKQIKDFLAEYGNYRVMTIKVCREPINNKIVKVADLATKGQFSINRNNLNYDVVFHLYMKIQIIAPTGGQVYSVLLERNQRVNISISNKEPSDGGKCIPVVFSKILDLNTFVMKDVSDSTWVYDAFENNCQGYVINRLRHNGLLNKELEDFINQDVVQLLPNKLLQGVVSGATNIANLFENIWKGGKLDNITMKVLKQSAKNLKIKNYSKLRKNELINLIKSHKK